MTRWQALTPSTERSNDRSAICRAIELVIVGGFPLRPKKEMTETRGSTIYQLVRSHKYPDRTISRRPQSDIESGNGRLMHPWQSSIIISSAKSWNMCALRGGALWANPAPGQNIAEQSRGRVWPTEGTEVASNHGRPSALGR